MSHERELDLTSIPMKSIDGRNVSLDCSWPALTQQSGTDLTEYYSSVLRALGQQHGILGDIFSGSQSRFSNPVNLKRLLDTIDETAWIELDVNIKADAFEGLLEKAANEGKKGAGQYFTPRLLIQSIVRCMKPDPRSNQQFKIGDPACGTGEFLVSAYEWFLDQTSGGSLDRDLARRVKTDTYYGQDLVPRPRRLALMNMYLHGLEPHISLGDSIYEVPDSTKFEVILTNPPFGTRGANQAPEREDFVISTSNKQLNFLQHIITALKQGGRAAVVVPDNCLFADQAGEVFKVITEDCSLHTVFRLPNGTFTPYSPGTKTNVVFFTKGLPTESVWIYDGRTNVPRVTKKDRPLTSSHFEEFEKCFGSDPNGRSPRSLDDSPEASGWMGGNRWRCFDINDIRNHDFKIDSLKWLRDEALEDATELPPPEELVTEAVAELETAISDLNDIIGVLEQDGVAITKEPS